MSLFLLLIFFLLVVVGAPVFVALSFSSFATLLFFTDLPLMVVAQRMLGGIDKFSLMSVPFFILGANVMKKGGIADRILKWSEVMVGSTRGGLAFTTIIACMFFGAVSGSSPATVIAIGGLMYPALKANNYDGGFNIGLITSSGSIALLIPPSISAIIYGSVTGASVGALFMAGVGAGLIYSVAYLIYAYIYARKNKIEPGRKTTSKEKIKATLSASWALGIPVIIMGGIYGGVFTATEASGVAAIYAILVSIFIYKEMDFKDLVQTCVDSAQSTAQLMFLLAGASIFGWVLTVAQVPQSLTNLIIGGNFGANTFLMLVNLLLLVAGMFIDGSSAIIITAPLIYPIAMQLGINPIHLGVIMVANAAIGMFTPPFGLNLFVAGPATGESMGNIMKGVIPFVIISIIALLFITYIPEISLFLPRLVYGNI